MFGPPVYRAIKECGDDTERRRIRPAPAHQPKFGDRAAAAGIDLQLPGHTHGGQVRPYHHLVRIDQPALAGLRHDGTRTLLYTSHIWPRFTQLSNA